MTVSIYTGEFESKNKSWGACYFTIKNWKLVETRMKSVAVQVTRDGMDHFKLFCETVQLVN